MRTANIFLTAILILVAVASGAGYALAADYTTAAEAVAAVVQLYEEEIDPARDLYVGPLHSAGGWAYAVAQPLDEATGDPLHELIPILARQTGNGWQAIAPALASPEEFNGWLDAAPAELMDDSEKAFLHQPEATTARTEAVFSGHYLPWPGGRFATVTQRDGGSDHAGQIDFVVDWPIDYGDDAIYNTKPGVVVFVKESSPDPAEPCRVYDCWKKANAVVVQHGPAEYSWYVHLAHNSVPDDIYVGRQIPAGVQIGRQGRTGWTTGDHLHYMVSSGHYTWSNPNDPNALSWATDIAATDFVEKGWDELVRLESYLSANYGQQMPLRRSINGLVRDSYGLAVGGAAVALVRTDGLGEARTVATDGLGAYKLPQVDDGQYVVGAGAGGKWQIAGVSASGATGVEAPALRLTRSCGSASLPVERAVEALVCAGARPSLPDDVAAPLDTAAVAPLLLSAHSGINNAYLEWEPTNSGAISYYRILRAVGDGATLTPLATTFETVYFDQSAFAGGTRVCYRIQGQRSDGAVLAESNIGCVVAQTVSLWVPHVEARPGDRVMVPVNVRNARGLRLGSAEIVLDYNPRLLVLRGVASGALAQGYTWSTSVSGQGNLNRVRVIASSSTAPALYGSGALFWLNFEALPSVEITGPLDLRDGAGGSAIYLPNSSQPVALNLLDGAFYMEPVQRFLHGDLDGNGLVQGEDGLLAARLASGWPGTSRQVRAADLTGDGRIDAADVSALLTYANLGSWPASASYPAAQAGTASLDNVTSILGGAAATNLRVSGAGGWAGGTFWLAYDPALVSGVIDAAPAGIGIGRQVAFYDEGAGLARVVIGGATPLTGNGVVAQITFRVGGSVPSGTSTTLFLADTALHDANAQDYATSFLQLLTGRVSSTLYVEYLASFLPRVSR